MIYKTGYSFHVVRGKLPFFKFPVYIFTLHKQWLGYNGDNVGFTCTSPSFAHFSIISGVDGHDSSFCQKYSPVWHLICTFWQMVWMVAAIKGE